MVVPILGLVAAAVITVFLSIQAAHLLHWLGIGAGLVAAVSVFLYLQREEVEFVGVSWMDTVLFAVGSATAGFVVFRAVQYLLATAGLVTALIVVGLLVLGGPALVFGVLQSIIDRVV